jgi:hypothetical protein
LLEEATITMPLRKFAEVPGMQARLNKAMRTSSQAVTLAKTDISHASAKRPYQTMKLQPGKVLLNGVSTRSTILDTGATFSMISESFVEQCILQSQLTDNSVSYVTADGNTAISANMLHVVALEIGECTFTTNLAIVASSVFDILLGVDFLDTAKAVIQLNRMKVFLTGPMNGMHVTQPFTLSIIAEDNARPLQAMLHHPPDTEKLEMTTPDDMEIGTKTDKETDTTKILEILEGNLMTQ